MDKEKIIEIANDAENRSNNDLFNTRNILETEFNNTKDLIINLTRHMDGIEELYDKVNDEIKKRTTK